MRMTQNKMKNDKIFTKKSNVIPGNLPSFVFWQSCPWQFKTTKEKKLKIDKYLKKQ